MGIRVLPYRVTITMFMSQLEALLHIQPYQPTVSWSSYGLPLPWKPFHHKQPRRFNWSPKSPIVYRWTMVNHQWMVDFPRKQVIKVDFVWILEVSPWIQATMNHDSSRHDFLLPQRVAMLPPPLPLEKSFLVYPGTPKVSDFSYVKVVAALYCFVFVTMIKNDGQ